jgi:urea transport system permease protein
MNVMQQIVDGVSVSSSLLLVSLGLAITFGVMKIINLAHGELIMVGAYTAYAINTVAKLPFFVAVIAAFVVTALVGALIERFVLRSLYGRPMETLLATFGISIMLQQIVRILFGATNKAVISPISGTLHLGDIVIPYLRLFIIGFSILMLLLTAWLLFRTKFGMLVRTVSQNRSMSDCLGINTSRIDLLTFSFGAGITGVAGSIIATLRNVSPTMGVEYMIDSFLAVVLGGVGSLIGTALGSVIIGEATQLLAYFGGEIGARIIIFLIVIVVIRFRPEGLIRMESR